MSNDPALEPSTELDDRHLELARQAGESYQQAVDHMIEEVAETGAKTETGDYLVGFAQEEAEGMYRLEDGDLTWSEPSDAENCHLEVVVASAAEGRFLPNLSVRATIEADDGGEVGPVDVPFVWHPGVYHYGRNLELPGSGTYDVVVEADPPTFPRHDRENGDRYADPVEVRFEDVDVEVDGE